MYPLKASVYWTERARPAAGRQKVPISSETNGKEMGIHTNGEDVKILLSAEEVGVDDRVVECAGGR